jgi:hypothetical protein
VPVFHVEMRWRCGACRNENLGRFKVCQTCSKPKGLEAYYDAAGEAQAGPGQAVTDPGQAVTDPALVALATAGADWECRYCRTKQSRRLARCDNCGAPEREVDEPAAIAPRAFAASALLSEPEDEVAFRSALRVRRRRIWGIALTVVVALAAFVYWLQRPRVVEAHVTARYWKHTVFIERYQIAAGQGFAENRPSDAFDIVTVGERHHHDDRVRDGTESESYSERVACGEDCQTTSVTCTANDNGFKTCSGGDTVCTTRYCDETRYRDVPRYKNVPVSAPWFTWHAWQWLVVRQVADEGTQEAPSWPTPERLALNAHCGSGEQERERREAAYRVELEDADHKDYSYAPRGLDELLALPIGTKKSLRVIRDSKIELVAP